MAQRKSPPPGKPAAKKGISRPAGKPGAAPSSTTKAGAAKTATDRKLPVDGGRGAAGRPPARKGKSIVNQKQTPWGLIAAATAVVVFAAVVIIAVVATHKSGSSKPSSTSTGGQTVDKNDRYRQPELAAAKAISGVTYRVEGQHNHVEGHITYDASPPVGGNHSQYWADCTGTVYSAAIANENAVHMLEHGAIWITYNPKTLPASELTQLKTYVAGVDRLALSPYPDLKSPISLQSWGYQLFVDKASDPRIAQFISTLKFNSKTTPEPGASCSQPTFKQHPSTFGNPLWTPASG
jgi:Protein of unknown function (DUF3105)